MWQNLRCHCFERYQRHKQNGSERNTFVFQYKKKFAESKEFKSSLSTRVKVAIEVDINRFCPVSTKFVISVYVHVRKGHHDNSLTWPLIGEVTVTLLNQLADKDHYSGVIPLAAMRPGKVMEFFSYITHDRLSYCTDPLSQGCSESYFKSSA